MKSVKKNCLAQKMTEKIAVKVNVTICFGKKCKNLRKKIMNTCSMPC